MDEIDRDAEFEEKILAKRIEAAATVKPEAEAHGKCLNCGTRLRSKTRRWCDEDCRDDWQFRQARTS